MRRHKLVGLSVVVLVGSALATRLPASAGTVLEAPVSGGAVSGSYSAQDPSQSCFWYGGTGFSVGPLTIATTVQGDNSIPVVIHVPVLTGSGGVNCGPGSINYFATFNPISEPVTGTDALGEAVTGSCAGGPTSGDFRLSDVGTNSLPLTDVDLSAAPATQVTFDLDCALQLGAQPVTDLQIYVSGVAVPGGWASGFTATADTAGIGVI
jgi:hypothetical protein